MFRYSPPAQTTKKILFFYKVAIISFLRVHHDIGAPPVIAQPLSISPVIMKASSHHHQQAWKKASGRLLVFFLQNLTFMATIILTSGE